VIDDIFPFSILCTLLHSIMNRGQEAEVMLRLYYIHRTRNANSVYSLAQTAMLIIVTLSSETTSTSHESKGLMQQRKDMMWIDCSDRRISYAMCALLLLTPYSRLHTCKKTPMEDIFCTTSCTHKTLTQHRFREVILQERPLVILDQKTPRTPFRTTPILQVCCDSE
jgi:hypothetical protein